MSNYRRVYEPGGCNFFTLVTHGRAPIFADPSNVERLRVGLRHVMAKRMFTIDAMVVLPDHLHSIWRLPENDMDFPSRWRLVKHYVAVGLPLASTARGEKQVWQRRFWEHLIRNEQDWRRHMDYIHYNPVKHGYVEAPGDWPHSSFRRCVERGWYLSDWGRSEPADIAQMDLE